MNWKKVFTIAALTGFSASVATGQGTAPTIVQGDYISNVFGNSNFIKNPNAKLNNKDVTVSNATVTRSTTTPLVATSEFNITTSTSTGYADWALRTFDAGMKNNNCEARFTYRGFTVGSTKAQILQGTNVVAELTLIGDANNPKIASINFPCGDLSAVTKFRLQQATASLTGTNEIGAIYTGLATNMANVAQAETVVRAYIGATQSIPSGTTTKVAFNTETLDVYDEFNTSTNTFTAKRAGQYLITGFYMYDSLSWSLNQSILSLITKNGADIYAQWFPVQGGITNYFGVNITQTINLAVGDTLYLATNHTSGVNKNIFASNLYSGLSIARFPSSSELVVTPERQNVFASVKGVASGQANQVTSASWTKLTAQSTMTRTTFGRAKVETNNDYSITIENMPVGSYYISVTNAFQVASVLAGSTTACFFALADSATGGAQIASTQASSTSDSSLADQDIWTGTFGGVYQNTSVANRTFFVQAQRPAGGGYCSAYSDSNRPLTITVIPLDQPSNSALYVQGPVKAAETGAAIPSGYQMEGINSVTSSLTSQSNGAYKTGTGLTLNAGVYLVTGYVETTGVAPTSTICGLTKTANGAPIDDDTSMATRLEISDANNTLRGFRCKTSGYFRVTSSTTFYITNYVNAPTSSGYTFNYLINAIRLN